MSSASSLIFEKERRFREFQIWPFAAVLDIRSWLTNFEEEHHEFALRLLEGFTYLADPIIDAMLRGAVQRLVNEAALRPLTSTSFFQETLFVIVQGERPSVVDSSHIYARKLRDQISVPETRIKNPIEALKIAGRCRNIVFVDDFIGSGQQMLHTWQREHEIAPGAKMSFEQLSTGGRHSFYYCATVCSSVVSRISALETELV